MASNLNGWTSDTHTVYEYVRDHPGATGRQVSDWTGIDRGRVNMRLDNLVSQRYLDRELSSTRGGATKYSPSALSPATPPPAIPRDERVRPPRRPKWVGPITAEQETPDAVRPRTSARSLATTSPAGSIGEPQQTAASVSPAREVEPLHTPAAALPGQTDELEAKPPRRIHRRKSEEIDADMLAPPAFTFEVQPIDLAGWREEEREIVEVLPAQGITGEVYTGEENRGFPHIEPARMAAVVDKVIAALDPMPKPARGKAFTPDNRAGAELTIFNCKIDEAHGPEVSLRGYCAPCLRRYGPIA